MDLEMSCIHNLTGICTTIKINVLINSCTFWLSTHAFLQNTLKSMYEFYIDSPLIASYLFLSLEYHSSNYMNSQFNSTSIMKSMFTFYIKYIQLLSPYIGSIVYVSDTIQYFIRACMH